MTTLAYAESGTGVPVVLLHAFPLSRVMWQQEAEQLAPLARIILPDLPGFGGSARQPHPSISAMAAAYASHLCQNHPFVDGNKRTALACALVFLALNGVEVLDPRGVLTRAMVSVASGRMNQAALAKLLRGLPVE